jgi:hypothetical protein
MPHQRRQRRETIGTSSRSSIGLFVPAPRLISPIPTDEQELVPTVSRRLQMVHQLHHQIHHDASGNDHGANQSNQPEPGGTALGPARSGRSVD